ncbi:MAG: gluconokinase, GntK/IdnK-type [Verrucomicrobiota bacterium]
MPEGKNEVFIVMGVSGSGKSAVAAALAIRLNAGFLDGDYLHPRTSVEKMRNGIPLDDADRAPWLQRVNDAIFSMSGLHRRSFLVCSALKRRYRDVLRDGNPGLRFIYLKGTPELIAERLASRSGHFFQPEMLESQFRDLEEPQADEPEILTVSVHFPLAGLIEKISGEVS